MLHEFDPRKGLWFEADKGAGGGSADGASDHSAEADTKDDLTDEPEGLEGQSNQPATLEEALALLSSSEKLRKQAQKEAKERRLKIAEFEKSETERKKSEMTEIERLKAEATEKSDEIGKLQARISKLVVENAVARKADRFVSAEAVIRLLDLDKIKIGEDGEIEGIDEALEQLAKDYPFLVAKTKSPDIDEKGKGKSEEGDQKTKEEKEDDLRKRFRIRK